MQKSHVWREGIRLHMVGRNGVESRGERAANEEQQPRNQTAGRTARSNTVDF